MGGVVRRGGGVKVELQVGFLGRGRGRTREEEVGGWCMSLI